MSDIGHLEVVAGYLRHAFEREAKLWARFEENLAAAEQALAEARADPHTPGSTGQLVAHPGFGVAARCDELALKFYRELSAGQDQVLGDLAREFARSEGDRSRQLRGARLGGRSGGSKLQPD